MHMVMFWERKEFAHIIQLIYVPRVWNIFSCSSWQHEVFNYSIGILPCSVVNVLLHSLYSIAGYSLCFPVMHESIHTHTLHQPCSLQFYCTSSPLSSLFFSSSCDRQLQSSELFCFWGKYCCPNNCTGQTITTTHHDHCDYHGHYCRMWAADSLAKEMLKYYRNVSMSLLLYCTVYLFWIYSSQWLQRWHR